MSEQSRIPFEICARVSSGETVTFIAVANMQEITSESYRIGSGKRRRETAQLWADDKRVCQGQTVNSKDIEDALCVAEIQARKKIESEDDDSSPSTATLLVNLISEQAELFHDPDGEPYASVVLDGARQTFRTRSKKFRTWASGILYRTTERAANAQAIQDALNVIAYKAVFDGPEYAVSVRIAKSGAALYIDLCNEAWEVVEVTPRGWDVISSERCPVRFIRRKGMRPLPRPLDGGCIELLQKYVNLPDDEDWFLGLSWLIGAFQPDGPYPVLMLSGEQGSAKSTTGRVLRALVDPNEAPLRSKPRNERDLAIAASNSWCIAYDNISDVQPWLSDAVCRVATGGGFATRELFTDQEETILKAKRPILLNGIGTYGDRPDLLDRAIHLHLPTIPEEKRRDEAKLWAEFAVDQPSIFGAVLTAVSKAMGRIDAMELERLPRMADFAKWVVAAEPALPWEPGAFIEAYSDNRKDGDRVALEASPIWSVLETLIADNGGTLKGTATELLTALNQRLDGEGTKPRKARPDGWPKQANKLTTAISRIAPNLRAIGYTVLIESVGKAKTKTITFVAPLAEVVRNPSPASPASTANRPGAAENGHRAGDGRVIDGRSASIDHPQENRVLDAKNAIAGDAGDRDDQMHSYSDGDVGVIE